ncbi:MAG: T9SS type A sorting domain-containing protein [Flavobacteriales bacterium]|nr:T9SS type A sorting domain-containing protein [Flavobacteriales bacterium]MCB9167163.1 T9SS type A sorting domain-containing protein [Flavobacteriales bacterium]
MIRTLSALAAFTALILPRFAAAQCNPGEVEVTIAVTTDDYGYETYWELLPNGDPCGTNTIFFGGNTAVGCNGAGAQQQTPGGYGDNLTITEGPWCLTEGAAYDIFWADDWGDAGLSFEVFVDGVSAAQFVGTGLGETFTFTAEPPPARDMTVTKLNCPLYAFADDDVVVEGTIKTLGGDPVTGFTLNYRVDNDPAVSEAITGLNLVAGTSYAFAHGTPWTPMTTGTHTLAVWADAINGGADLVPANDTMTITVVINTPIPNIIDDYLSGTPQVVMVANADQDLLVPRDLDFHPDLARRELWVINKDVEATGGSTVKFTDVGGPAMTWLWQRDVNAWHFMSLPTGIAFGDNGNFSTCPGVFDANHNGGTPFTGPSLWDSDPAVYAQPIFGGLGSHIDMLHVTPNSQGIAHEKANVYWVVDGFNGDIVRHDFMNDHGPGNDYHGDAIIRRYADFTITKDPNDHIVSHCVLDKHTGWLYVVDHGGQRVLRLDIHTGSVTGPATYGPWETYVEYSMMGGYTWQEIISSGLQQPAGIDVIGDRLLVSDHATGEVVIYDLADPNFTELGRIQTGSAGLMGIKIGPEGHIWGVNATTNELIRIDPGVATDVTGPTGDEALQVYPVPVTDRLFVRGAGEHSANVDLLDARGRAVWSGTYRTAQRGIDVSTLGAGSYVLRIGATDAPPVHRQVLVVR